MKIIYLLFPVLYLFSCQLNGQNPCLVNGQISVQSASLGSPLTGPFQPNEELVVELIVLWNGVDCNWLHGVSPSFGNGWRADSFDDQGTPEVLIPLNNQSNSTGNPGNFFWYPENTVTYKYYDSPSYAAGDGVPAGWYSTATSPGINNPCASNYLSDPNCSCGITQPCGEVFFHVMRFKLITGSAEDCESGITDLDISFKLFSDFETGSGVSPVCTDLPEISQSYQMICSVPPDLAISPQPIIDVYNSGNLELDFRDFVAEINPEVGYQWRVLADNEITGFSNCTEDCGTTLAHQLNNSDLHQTKNLTYRVNAIRPDGMAGPFKDFLVKVHPEISLTTNYVSLSSNCSGETEGLLEGAAYGGAMEDEDEDYLYLWNTGQTSSSISVYPEETTTYELTVTDQLGTTQSSAVTVEVFPTPIVSWNTPVESTYCVGQEYLICVEPVAENTTIAWNATNASVTLQENINCIAIMWENVVENPTICVQTTNEDGCESTALCQGNFLLLDAAECLAVANQEVDTEFIEIFPNPSTDWVTIEGVALELLNLTDARGQLLRAEKLFGATSFQLQVSDYPNGIYYLVVNETTVKKLAILR